MTKVIMFHSVGLEKSDWLANFLSVPVTHTESFLKFIANNKYQPLFLDKWYELEDHSQYQNKQHVALTFDDGYLDNWVYLFPLLEKYGIKATIFINPEFVDPSVSLRPNLKDAWQGRVKVDDLNAKGFLNWPEISQMHESGLVDIQSHSMSHNWYFTSERIIDFYSPQKNNLYWLAWLAKPERKPFWINEDQSSFVQTGTPVFENGRSLGSRRYFPDKELIKYSIELFQKNPGISKEDASSKCITFMTEKSAKGRMETDQEMMDRYRYELKESKKILENKLKKKVDFLCWPGGAYNDLSIALSREAGYRASTLASREHYRSFTNYEPYKRIVRSSLGASFTTNKRCYIDPHPETMIRRFKVQEGKWFWKIPGRVKKMYYMMFK